MSAICHVCGYIFFIIKWLSDHKKREKFCKKKCFMTVKLRTQKNQIILNIYNNQVVSI